MTRKKEPMVERAAATSISPVALVDVTSSPAAEVVVETVVKNTRVEALKKLLVFLRDEVVSGNPSHVEAINNALKD